MSLYSKPTTIPFASDFGSNPTTQSFPPASPRLRSLFASDLVPVQTAASSSAGARPMLSFMCWTSKRRSVLRQAEPRIIMTAAILWDELHVSCRPAVDAAWQDRRHRPALKFRLVRVLTPAAAAVDRLPGTSDDARSGDQDTPDRMSPPIKASISSVTPALLQACR